MNYEFALNSYQSNFPENLSVVGKHHEKWMSVCDLKIIAKAPSAFIYLILGRFNFLCLVRVLVSPVIQLLFVFLSNMM